MGAQGTAVTARPADADAPEFEFKSFRFKAAPDEQGEFEAIVATLDVPDKYDDIFEKGALVTPARAKVSAYGHNAARGQVPVGVATLEERGDKLIATGKFNRELPEAVKTISALKFALDNNQPDEWSIGYRAIEVGFEIQEGQYIRRIKKYSVFEVSPVLIGVAQDTATVSLKGADQMGTTATPNAPPTDTGSQGDDGQNAGGQGDPTPAAPHIDYNKLASDAANAVLKAYAGDEKAMTGRLKHMIEESVKTHVSEAKELITQHTAAREAEMAELRKELKSMREAREPRDDPDSGLDDTGYKSVGHCVVAHPHFKSDELYESTGRGTIPFVVDPGDIEFRAVFNPGSSTAGIDPYPERVLRVMMPLGHTDLVNMIRARRTVPTAFRSTGRACTRRCQPSGRRARPWLRPTCR